MDGQVVSIFDRKKLPIKSGQEACFAKEQRMHTRYKLTGKARITTESGECIWCQMSDISRSGLQISGDSHALKTLLPHFHRPDWKTPVGFEIEFSVPTSQCLDAPVTLECAVIYCRRIKADEFSIGAQFKQFAQGAEGILEDFLCHVAQPC